MSDANIQDILTQITQIQVQINKFNNYISNTYNNIILMIPMIFISIIMFIKNKYGDKKIIKILLSAIIIILILYLCFVFVSNGCIGPAIQSSMFQGLFIAGMGGITVDSNIFNLNDTISDLLNYIST